MILELSAKGQWRSQNTRTLKKLRTSNGDYCIKQWFYTIKEQFLGVWKITFTTLGELPWVLLFLLRACVNCVMRLRQWWYLDPLLSSAKKRSFWIRKWPVRKYVRFVTYRQSYFIHARAAAHLQKSQFVSSCLVSTREGFIVTFWLGEGGLSDGMKKYRWCVRRYILSDKAFINGLILVNRLKVR